MVSFHDNPEKYNSVAMLAKLDEEVTLRFACYSEFTVYNLSLL